MKRLCLLLLLFAGALSSIAQDQVIKLYDGPAPGSETWNWTEAENDNNMWQTKVVYNVTSPTLTVFNPEKGKANGTAAIICPGGAFYALSINSEGYDVAKWLAKKGVTCFVLKYRLARTMGNDPTEEVAAKMGKKEFEEETGKVIPLSIADGKAAIAYVRQHAAAFGVYKDRIGIIGFSAGGTVTTSAAFGNNEWNRPDFIVPVYPYFPDGMQGEVTKGAPPMFVVAASDDGLGLAPHSVDLYTRWLKAGNTAEIHMYAKGGHGFGMRKQNMPSDQWIERLGDWMDQMGYMKKKEFDPALVAYERKEFKFAEGQVLPYRILYPENYDPKKKYPMILFLHGAGERGKDNEKQLIHGSRLFLNAENRKNFPAIVVFPQCPEESFWGTVNVDRSKQPIKLDFAYGSAPVWPQAAANALVRSLIKEGSVDDKRVYITGLSMGGMGTFESVYRNPDLYAAALPICGGGDPNSYSKKQAKIPFWVFHGAADAVVDVKLSRDMVERLKALKATVKYSEYPGVNHNSWDNAFAEPEYLKWMFGQRRK